MDLIFQNRFQMLAARTPTHLYLRPHPALRPYIAHYTLCLGSGEVPTQSAPLTLLPDASGCLVFSLEQGGLEGRMYGPTTACVTVENDLGRFPLRFFVEFKPGGLAAFTPVPQWELADRIYPLPDVAATLQRAISAAWARAGDLDTFMQSADAALLALWAPAEHRLPAGLLAARGGDALLLEETGYSPRHLSRLFRTQFGVGAKRFSHVLRINAAASALRAGPVRLTALAQELGYFDQAHFIHTFHSVCGVSPTGYRASLSEFYNEPLKLMGILGSSNKGGLLP